MKSVQPLIASLMVLFPAATLLADDIANWKTYSVASHGNLTVNLRVRPEATLADEEWIAIEFVNQGGSPIVVKEARYNMKRTDHGLQSGQPTLAAGYRQSLFPDAHKTSPPGPSVIPPGIYRVVEQPSSYSSALLGLAPQRGQRIKATIQLELVLDDGTKVATQPQPTPFEFKWLRPDADGFERMRGRIKHLVANPRLGDLHSNYIVDRLLRIDDVSSALTLPEGLAGLEKFSGGRDRLARFLDRRFPNDPVLVASLEERLRRPDKLVLYDLSLMPNTWDDKFLEPLLAKFEGNEANWRLAFMVLELHGPVQKTNAAVARRLTREIVASGVLSSSDDGSGTSDYKLCKALEFLGRTHDRAALKHVKPFLDDKRYAVFTSASLASLARSSSRLPALRVCDYALEAALMLLDGDAVAMYPQFKNDGTRWEATTKRRDELIAKVKKRIVEN